MPRQQSITRLLILLTISIFPVTTNAQHTNSPVDRSCELTLVSDDFGLADGPAWNGRSLYVPDVKQSVIKRYTPSQDKWQVVHKGADRISASVFSHGKLFVANNSGAKIQTFAGNKFSAGPTDMMVIEEADKPKKRPNDLVVDHHGGVYFTLTRQNQVVYLAPDGTSNIFSETVESPNGITISPDNSTLYVAAYKAKKIVAIAITEPGSAGQATDFAVMDDGEALGADGMSIDRAGNVYCAGANDIWIWNPNGKLLDKINCPTRPINCTFGDAEMRTLYITGFGGLYKQQMKISGVAPAPVAETALISGESTPSTVIPEGIISDLDVVYAEYGTRKILVDIFRPAKAMIAQPAVVVVHGGGWLKGDKTKFRSLALDIAKGGFVTAAIEYRLGDEARFPAAMHDCSAAVRFLRANAEQYNIDPNRIAAVGGSAGGHLVGLMASASNDRRLQGDGGNSDQSSAIQFAIVMAGPMQIATGSVAERSVTGKTSNATRRFGATIDQNPAIYRLADAYEHLSKDTCPVFFLTGEHDNPARNELSRQRLKELGITTELRLYQDGRHGCWNRLPWFKLFSSDIVRTLRSHL